MKIQFPERHQLPTLNSISDKFQSVKNAIVEKFRSSNLLNGQSLLKFAEENKAYAAAAAAGATALTGVAIYKLLPNAGKIVNNDGNCTNVNETPVNCTDANGTLVNCTDTNGTLVNYTDVNGTAARVNAADVNKIDQNATQPNATSVYGYIANISVTGYAVTAIALGIILAGIAVYCGRRPSRPEFCNSKPIDRNEKLETFLRIAKNGNGVQGNSAQLVKAGADLNVFGDNLAERQDAFNAIVKKLAENNNESLRALIEDESVIDAKKIVSFLKVVEHYNKFLTVTESDENTRQRDVGSDLSKIFFGDVLCAKEGPSTGETAIDLAIRVASIYKKPTVEMQQETALDKSSLILGDNVEKRTDSKIILAAVLEKVDYLILFKKIIENNGALHLDYEKRIQLENIRSAFINSLKNPSKKDRAANILASSLFKDVLEINGQMTNAETARLFVLALDKVKEEQEKDEFKGSGENKKPNPGADLALRINTGATDSLDVDFDQPRTPNGNNLRELTFVPSEAA